MHAGRCPAEHGAGYGSDLLGLLLGALSWQQVLKALQRQQQAFCVQVGQMHLLSSQTSALNGQLVSSHLVQKTTPAAFLTAEQVRL